MIYLSDKPDIMRLLDLSLRAYVACLGPRLRGCDALLYHTLGGY